jgi:hypothetical protein
MSTTVDFSWWERQDAHTFLAHDWDNPARGSATAAAIALAKHHGGALLEVGPGNGVDYANAFRAHVLAGTLRYTGVEGTHTFFAALAEKHPEATWEHRALADLAPLSADVVYARHVLEHQPALVPALPTLLAAARHAVVLDWYRPPADVSVYSMWENVHFHTFARAEVLRVVAESGFLLARMERVDHDEVWQLERIA